MGSTTVVLHAPPEREIDSVTEVWALATEPGMLKKMNTDKKYSTIITEKEESTVSFLVQ